MRRTKIVATVGPATARPDALRALVEAGTNVVRLNAAHGDPDDLRAATALARDQAADLGTVVGVLVDLPGPKMRTGEVAGGAVELVPGAGFTLAGDPVEGDVRRVATTLPELAEWVHPGDEVFLADGEIVLRVDEIAGRDVRTAVVRGGTLRSRKGLHLPRAEHRVEPFGEADAVALDVALEVGADFVGLSFVRHASDVERVRERLPKRGPRPLLVPKIETAAALEGLHEIVAAGDAVMVARGDLGIQVAPSRVPLLQKEIIRFCNRAGKPVITATQMLESMTRSPLPTRAEVNDVANAVIDGTDALMLSEETAVGRHPIEAVRVMAETAAVAEEWPRPTVVPDAEARGADRVAWAVAHAAVSAAEDLGVAAILCPTRSGATARNVAAFRPRVPVVGISARPDVLGGLTVSRGVRPLAVAGTAAPGEQLAHAVEAVREAGLVASGELVAVVAGTPGPRPGSTDLVRIVRA